MCLIVTPNILSNNILRRSFEQGIPVSPMKLQKLIYFVYRDYLKETKKPIFNERFEVWKHGPVLPSVYQEFKNYGAESIKEYAEVKDGEADQIREVLGSALVRVLENVWNRYKNYSGIELSKITHLEGSAWSSALNNDKYFLSDEDIISDDTK